MGSDSLDGVRQEDAAVLTVGRIVVRIRESAVGKQVGYDVAEDVARDVQPGVLADGNAGDFQVVES